MKSLHTGKAMNLALWSLFFKVLEEGSFSRVADQRGIDRTQVSRMITTLEDEIGHELLVRNGPKIQPTQIALEAQQHIEPLIKGMHDALAQMMDSSEEESGSIRFGAMPGFMQTQIVPLLVEFQRIYPHITFDVTADDDPQAFMRGQTDLMLYYGPVHNPGLVEHWVTRAIFIPCASPRYIEMMGMPKTPADLARHNGILYTGRVRPHSDVLEKAGEQTRYKWKSMIRFNNILSAKAAAVASGGIVLDMPMHHCYNEIVRGELIPVLNGWHVPNLDNYIGSTAEAAKLKRVQIFIDWYIRRRREIEGEFRRTLQEDYAVPI